MSGVLGADDMAGNITCPDDETLSRYLHRDAATQTTALLAAHLDSCELCRNALDALAHNKPPAAASSRTTISKGTRIGRYIIEGELGAGGMGIVFRARDIELARPVAIKLLRHTGLAAEGDRRLLQEAKAMAALQHPNIVTLYDVGEHEGAVYLAMEVVGQTLREWLDSAPRTWRTITDAFVQAARGLAAAHEIRIVHRDFKPDNVFLGSDGRIRVGDFGLARTVAEAVSADGLPSTYDDRATAITGTVRYMAPEQLAGKVAGPRSDQFSFCVALYEALCRKLPFGDGTLAELRVAYAERREPAFPAKLPRYVVRVLERGLRVDPAERFESMGDVIAALTTAPARRHRIVLATCAAATLAIFSGTAYVLGRDPSATPATTQCNRGRALVDAVWNQRIDSQLLARFTSSSTPYLRELGPRVVGKLRAYTDSWVAMHHEACSATIVEGRQSPELMDLRMRCLDGALGGTRALVRELEGGSDDQLKLAMDATGKLAPLADCADEHALRSRDIAQPPPAAATNTALARSLLLSARFADATGAYPRALSLGSQALDIAMKTDYGPVKAEALYEVGLALSNLERGPEASERLHQAATTADASRDDQIAAAARVTLVFNLGMREGKFDEAERMAEYADASIHRLGGSPNLEAELLLSHAAILNRSDHPDQALPLSLQALAVLEKMPAPDQIRLGRTYNRIGNDVGNLGRYGDSLNYFEKAFAIFERELGPNHPLIANVLTNRGGSLRYLGRYDEAIVAQGRAVEIREQVFGADHPEVAAALTNLSNTYNAKGDRQEAYTLRKRALAIAEAKLPPAHNNLLIMRLNILESLTQLGLDKDGGAFCDRWLPVERRDRAERPTTARWMAVCAVPYLRLKQTQHAWDVYREAVALIDKTKDVQSEDYLQDFGEELLRRGQAAEALPILERSYRHQVEVVGAKNPDTIAVMQLVEQARAKLHASGKVKGSG